jgi:hypothetical protein
MALAPSRQVFQTNIKYSLNAVAERGVVCTILPGSTTDGEVEVLAAATGAGLQAVGILLDDVEDLNYDRHGEYRQRSVVDVGSQVGLCVKGDLETDQISGAISAGQDAYLGANGQLTATQADDGLGNLAPRIGWFQTGLNANGFASVHVDL